jgi:hypothetical protein
LKNKGNKGGDYGVILLATKGRSKNKGPLIKILEMKKRIAVLNLLPLLINSP